MILYQKHNVHDTKLIKFTVENVRSWIIEIIKKKNIYISLQAEDIAWLVMEFLEFTSLWLGIIKYFKMWNHINRSELNGRLFRKFRFVSRLTRKMFYLQEILGVFPILCFIFYAQEVVIVHFFFLLPLKSSSIYYWM